MADEGQDTISSRWVFTEKDTDGKKIVKARMVARGFEEDVELLGIRTDSPTCSKHSLRLVMVSAAMYNWDINSIDIASAFLQGNEISREIYLKPPKDVCSKGKIWRLKRCIYGLNDAPREWYKRVTEELMNLGAVRSLLDPAMFMWYDEENMLTGHLVSHVDDFVFGGTEDWKKQVIDKIKDMFKISAESHVSFKYLGLNVKQSDDCISIDQRSYIESIQPVDLPKERRQQKDEILTKEERRSLKSLSGKMMWVTNQTRPDMAFETCVMSNQGKNPTVKKIIEANKAVKKLKNTNNICIKFPSLGNPANISILAYGDGTHASLADGSSQGGFMVFLYDDHNVAPVIWQSKKLDRVTKSPLASETMALGETADAGLMIANLVQEIYQLPRMPHVKCVTDSKSLSDALHTTNTVTDMSLRVSIARLREMTDKGEIAVKWVEGKHQLADPLTKRGASSEALVQVLDAGKLTME